MLCYILYYLSYDIFCMKVCCENLFSYLLFWVRRVNLVASTRLRDEAVLTKIILRMQSYLENHSTPDLISKVYLLRIEHIYYKVCTSILQQLFCFAFEVMDVAEPRCFCLHAFRSSSLPNFIASPGCTIFR